MELIYFEKLSWNEIYISHGISRRLVGKLKKESEKCICDWYMKERPGIEMEKISVKNQGEPKMHQFCTKSAPK